MDVKKIQSMIKDLEIKKGVKLKELETAKAEVEDLRGRVEQFFGTSAPEDLENIRVDLEKQLAESMDKLKALGVDIN